MMSNRLRNELPERTCTKTYVQYRSFKKYLRDDFNKRCGYCDGHMTWLGKYRAFHIDHFAPWKKFETSHPSLKTDYDNLVFSCPYCNTFKGAKWVTNDPAQSISGNEGFIDPCDIAYDNSFERNNLGEILPLTNIGRYIYENLCLGLERHSIIWKIDKLLNLSKTIKEDIKSGQYSQSIRSVLREQLNLINGEIVIVIEQYKDLEY